MAELRLKKGKTDRFSTKRHAVYESFDGDSSLKLSRISHRISAINNEKSSLFHQSAVGLKNIHSTYSDESDSRSCCLSQKRLSHLQGSASRNSLSSLSISSLHSGDSPTPVAAVKPMPIQRLDNPQTTNSYDSFYQTEISPLSEYKCDIEEQNENNTQGGGDNYETTKPISHHVSGAPDIPVNTQVEQPLSHQPAADAKTPSTGVAAQAARHATTLPRSRRSKFTAFAYEIDNSSDLFGIEISLGVQAIHNEMTRERVKRDIRDILFKARFPDDGT